MEYLKLILFFSFIIFSCTSGSNNETVEAEEEILDVANLSDADASSIIQDLIPSENIEDLEEINTDALTAKSVKSDIKVEKEKEEDKSPELKIEEKKIEEKKIEVIKGMVEESPLKGKDCEEILKIFEGVTSGSTVVDYDIMNDPFFVICKNKSDLGGKFDNAVDDDVDVEPW